MAVVPVAANDDKERNLQMNLNVWQTDRQEMISRARQVLACSDMVVYLDTETTGLGSDDEVVEISVVDAAGAVLFDSLVRPTKPIPPGATGVHGISDADVAAARGKSKGRGLTPCPSPGGPGLHPGQAAARLTNIIIPR